MVILTQEKTLRILVTKVAVGFKKEKKGEVGLPKQNQCAHPRLAVVIVKKRRVAGISKPQILAPRVPKKWALSRHLKKMNSQLSAETTAPNLWVISASPEP